MHKRLEVKQYFCKGQPPLPLPAQIKLEKEAVAALSSISAQANKALLLHSGEKDQCKVCDLTLTGALELLSKRYR